MSKEFINNLIFLLLIIGTISFLAYGILNIIRKIKRAVEGEFTKGIKIGFHLAEITKEERELAERNTKGREDVL